MYHNPLSIEMGGNATGVSINVMIFKLCDREFTGTIEIYITKINLCVIERKTTTSEITSFSRFFCE